MALHTQLPIFKVAYDLLDVATIDELNIYDELTLSLDALNALENLLAGGANEVSPGGISMLLEPICARLAGVKTAMRQLQEKPAPRKAANQERIAA